MRQRVLERQRWLETLGLDMYSPAQCCDEGAVMLKQGLAEEVSVYEALCRASSCYAHHGSLRHMEHQTEENKQNELGTDLSPL